MQRSSAFLNPTPEDNPPAFAQVSPESPHDPFPPGPAHLSTLGAAQADHTHDLVKNEAQATIANQDFVTRTSYRYLIKCFGKMTIIQNLCLIYINTRKERRLPGGLACVVRALCQ